MSHKKSLSNVKSIYKRLPKKEKDSKLVKAKNTDGKNYHQIINEVYKLVDDLDEKKYQKALYEKVNTILKSINVKEMTVDDSIHLDDAIGEVEDLLDPNNKDKEETIVFLKTYLNRILLGESAEL